MLFCKQRRKKKKKKKRKWPPPTLLFSSSSLLVSCLTSTLSLSRLSYVCQEHGLHLTLSPWFQLLHGAGHVFTVYIMGCWEKRGRTWVLVPFGCHIQVCETLCVFFFLCKAIVCSSQRNAESRRPYEGTVITTPTLIGWDVPRVHSERRRVVKSHERVCCMLRLPDENKGLSTEPPLKVHHIPMKMWLWRWNINHDQLGIHRIHIPVIKFITWSSRQRFVLRKHLSKQQEKSKKSLASSLRKYWPQTISASMENNTINN